MKEKYYVNIENGAISQKSKESGASLAVLADEKDLNKIKEKLDNMDGANKGSYVRAHIPYYPQDESPENAKYDRNLKELYSLLHQLGDEETRQHIESIDILDEPGDYLV